jgi:hypothetical protein
MCNRLFTEPNLNALLVKIDQDLAAETRSAGCPHCGGSLHSAKYPRKLRETLGLEGNEETRRISFCCSVDGCRRRVTPPSVRFLGRKHYMGAIVVLLSALAQGPNPKRTQQLEALFGVSRRTLLRWQAWWKETVPTTTFWRGAKGLLMPPVASQRLCLDLVIRFCPGGTVDELGRLLRFLSPLSCPSPAVGMRTI